MHSAANGGTKRQKMTRASERRLIWYSRGEMRRYGLARDGAPQRGVMQRRVISAELGVICVKPDSSSHQLFMYIPLSIKVTNILHFKHPCSIQSGHANLTKCDLFQCHEFWCKNSFKLSGLNALDRLQRVFNCCFLSVHLLTANIILISIY